MITGEEEPRHFPGPGAALLLTVAAIAASVTIAAMIGPSAMLAALGVGEALGVGVVATLAARLVPEPQAERLGLRGFDLRLLLPLLGLLPAILLLSEVDNLVSAILPAPAPVESTEALVDRIDLDSTYARLQIAIISVGIAPVVEEWLFRGVVQQGIIAHIGSRGGVLFTALLFAPFHTLSLSAGTTLASAVVASLCLGVMLGTLRLATGSILPCILLSASMNAFGLGASWLSDRFPIEGFNAPGGHTPVLYLIPAATMAIAAFLPFLRLAREAPATLPLVEPSE